MFNVQFNVGASQAAIRRAVAELEDGTAMFEDIREYMIDSTRRRGQQGVTPDGKAWAPKRQSTLDRYKARGYGNLTKPLVGPTRRLLREIQGYVSKNGVVIGSSLIYSGVMQSGEGKGAFGNDRRGRPIPWGRIPAREWLGISQGDGAAIVDIAEEHLSLHLGDKG
jgi:phage gpG-like protein